MEFTYIVMKKIKKYWLCEMTTWTTQLFKSLKGEKEKKVASANCKNMNMNILLCFTLNLF